MVATLFVDPGFRLCNHADMKSALASFRKKQDLTLKALGEALGVDKSTVLRWERNGVSAERAVEIEKKLGGKVKRQELRPDIFGEAA